MEPENPTSLVVEASIPSDIGGWDIREAAIRLENGDMAALVTLPTHTKPVIPGAVKFETTYQMYFQVSNASVFEFKINHDVEAVRDYVDLMFANHNDDPVAHSKTIQKAIEESQEKLIKETIPSDIGAMPAAPDDGETYLAKGGEWKKYTPPDTPESGTTDHAQLENRDKPDQHTIGSVTGLVDALGKKANADDVTKALESKVDSSALDEYVTSDELSTALENVSGGGVGPHSHEMSDVNGLAGALGGKAATSHTHPASEISGLDDVAGSKITYGTTDLTAGSSALATGLLHCVYE